MPDKNAPPIYRRGEHGPFDIIGDVHGCYDELTELLEKLGYEITPGTAADGGRSFAVVPPPGRKALFVGDLVDRGPDSVGVLRLVMAMVRQGVALTVPGNHDDKLLRRLRGRKVQELHGLAETMAQLSAEPASFLEEVERFLGGLSTHLVLDEGRLLIAHAGLPEHMHGRSSDAVRSFTLFGMTTGERDEYGLPVRLNWAADYHGKALVVYGHTPLVEPIWIHNTVNIDTGCAFGGALTALRYPERALVSVPARRTYAERIKPLSRSL